MRGEAAIGEQRTAKRESEMVSYNISDARHCGDQPVKMLRHQSAGHRKYFMKPFQSLFKLWLVPLLFADRSPFVDHTRLFRVCSNRISQQKGRAARSVVPHHLIPESCSLTRAQGTPPPIIIC